MGLRRISAFFFVSLALPGIISCAPAIDSPAAIMADEGDKPEDNSEHAPSPDQTIRSLSLKVPSSDPVARNATLERYKHLDPNRIVPRNLLENAVLTFDANQSAFPNKEVLTIVDYSKRSSSYRWFQIDVKSGTVWPMHVAHGRGSDKNADGHPEVFSNVYGSKATSLGVYRTAESYDSKKFGYSLRVDGLSSTNSNARDRAIVIHPAWYVWESNVIQGMTEGCFGLSKSNAKQVIDQIKNGSMVFVDLSNSTSGSF